MSARTPSLEIPLDHVGIKFALIPLGFLALAAAVWVPAHAATEIPANSDASVSLEEIVVTATRRVERLQDVPIAVSVVTGDQLGESGFKSLADVQYLSPGVNFPGNGTGSGVRLRGVGSSAGFSSASEQNVGLVVDNVVIPFGDPIGSLGDVQRVEVLKGPQGTQFGKNSSSGVLNIVTQNPTLGKFEANAFGSYGSLSERDLHGTINAPIGDQAALQVFAFDRAHDGFIYNKPNNDEWGGEHISGTRAKLLYQPSESISALLIGDYSRESATGGNDLWTLRRLPGSFNPFFNPLFIGNELAGVAVGPHNNVSIEDLQPNEVRNNYGSSLELNLRLGVYNLTSITAWREMYFEPHFIAIDASPLPEFTAQNYGTKNKYYSQEVRLTSPDTGQLKYIVGIYASRRDVDPGGGQSAQLRPDPTNPGLVISISNGLGFMATRSDSIAGFVDGSFNLTDQFKLIGGLRVTQDKVKASTYSVIDPAYPPGPTATGFVVPYTATALRTSSVDGTDWSGRFGGEYKPSADLMFFATAARGYLGPTTTFSILTNTEGKVGPQKVIDFTVGAKMEFLDHRLTLDANAYYDKYTNLQTSVFTGGEFINGNAGGLKTQGFEIESALKPSTDWRLSLGYAYTKPTYTDFLTDCPQSIQISALGVKDPRCMLGPSHTRYQAAGQDLTFAPRNTLNAQVNFSHPLTAKLLFDGAVTYAYRDKIYNIAGDTLTRSDPYSLVNLNVGLGGNNSRWRVGLFVRNVFNVDYSAGIVAVPFADAGTLANIRTRDARRTIGGSLEARF